MRTRSRRPIRRKRKRRRRPRRLLRSLLLVSSMAMSLISGRTDKLVIGTTGATATETPKTTQDHVPSTLESAPTKSKRASIFNLGMFGKKEKETPVKKDETTSTSKETEPVAATAPQLDPVDLATMPQRSPSLRQVPRQTKRNPRVAWVACSSPRSPRYIL